MQQPAEQEGLLGGIRPPGTDTERPRRLAAQALDLLVTATHSQAGAVFSVAKKRAVLWRASGIDHRAIDRVDAALGAGIADRPVVRDDHAILPLRAGRQTLVFYLESPQTCSSSRKASALLPPLAALFVDEPDGPKPVSTAPSSFVDRRRNLEDLLEREEWNLSKVARVMGRSRVYVYRMLQEFGLGRPGGKRRCFGR